MSINVAINGFGRIGRAYLRVAMTRADVNVVAINDLTDSKTLAHLFKYDSVHGRFNGTVDHTANSIIVNGKEIKIFAQKDPAELPWAELGVSIVCESTGLFRDQATCQKHIDAGAKKVLISAPAKDPDITIVLGVNDELYDPEKHHIISNASCTTNCLAPVVKVLHNNFGIKNGLMTTIHAYTNDQRILDFPHSDIRRARAAAISMIPTTTGAAKAVGLVIPEMKGKIDGLAMRVPTPNVSVVDFVAVLEKDVTVDQVNAAFKEAAEGELKGYLGYSDESLVSIDFNGSHLSSIYDSGTTYVSNGNTVKVMSWYDNEMGYSVRMVDLTELVGKSL
ncbi:MAG: type I glyceraldehyde-3-phosphate dehydrogenase [Pseudomonadota bacterium]